MRSRLHSVLSTPMSGGRFARWTLLVGLGLAVGAPLTPFTPFTRLAAQAPDPLPVVSAEFAAPSHPVEWAHYLWIPACANAIHREEARATFELIQDTAAVDLAAPMPPPVIRVTQDCLRHFDVATLSRRDLKRVLHLATAIGADSLVRAVVTRQLAAVSGARAQGAVLDTAVSELMKAHQTPAKTALARALMIQGDALGPNALLERVSMHTTLDAPRVYDPDTVLAFRRQLRTIRAEYRRGAFTAQEQQAIEHSIQSDSAEEQVQIAWTTWLKSGQEADYQRWFALWRSRDTDAVANPLVGTVASRVIGAYWFNTPPGTLQGGSPAIVPVPGKVNVLVINMNGMMPGKQMSEEELVIRRYIHKMDPSSYKIDPDSEFFANRVKEKMFGQELKQLQHIHRTFPDLAITLVEKTTGAFRGNPYVGHSAAEAAAIHGFFTDALHVPGMLCVDSSTVVQTLPTGEVRVYNSANEEHYAGGNGDIGGGGTFIIDPKGRILGPLDWYAGDDSELEWIIRHLQAMEPKRKSP